MDAGFQSFLEGFGFGIMWGWSIQSSDNGVCGTRMSSRGFVRDPQCAAFLVNPRRVSSPLRGAQKNDLWRVRSSAIGLVRPQRASGARSVLWRDAYLPGGRGTARALQELWPREARTTRLSCRQSVLYQALCVLRGAALSPSHHQGYCRGTQSTEPAVANINWTWPLIRPRFAGPPPL